MEMLDKLKKRFKEYVQEISLCDVNLDMLETTWENAKGVYTKEQISIIKKDKEVLKKKRYDLWEEVELVFKQMTDIQQTYILKLLQEYNEKQDFDALDLIIEYMRMCGYPAPYNTLEAIISSQKLILEISIDLLDSPYLISNPKLIWFVKQVYDIFFHQYGIGGEPTEITDLFLKLSLKILEPRFYDLHENDITSYSYGCSIYFLSMMCHYIEDRPQDFFTIWGKIQAKPILFLAEHEKEWWLDSYQRLTQLPK